MRVVGKPEVIQLDEKSPMLRLARPALQRLLPPGRQVASDPRIGLRAAARSPYAVDRGLVAGDRFLHGHRGQHQDTSAGRPFYGQVICSTTCSASCRVRPHFA